jgi:hypothetical protein
MRCERESVGVVMSTGVLRLNGKEESMRFIGLDVHRTFAEVAVLAERQVHAAGRVATTALALEAFARTLGAADRRPTVSTISAFPRVYGGRGMPARRARLVTAFARRTTGFGSCI